MVWHGALRTRIVLQSSGSSGGAGCPTMAEPLLPLPPGAEGAAADAAAHTAAAAALDSLSQESLSSVRSWGMLDDLSSVGEDQGRRVVDDLRPASRRGQAFGSLGLGTPAEAHRRSPWLSSLAWPLTGALPHNPTGRSEEGAPTTSHPPRHQTQVGRSTRQLEQGPFAPGRAHGPCARCAPLRPGNGRVPPRSSPACVDDCRFEGSWLFHASGLCRLMPVL